MCLDRQSIQDMEKRSPVTDKVLASGARTCSCVMAWDHSLQQVSAGWTPGESLVVEKHSEIGTEDLIEGALTRRSMTLRNRQQIIKSLRLEKASKII